jgi:CubicO group peptidase (beta-lactamase class C family)
VFWQQVTARLAALVVSATVMDAGASDTAARIDRFFAALPPQAGASVAIIDADGRRDFHHAGERYAGPPLDGHAVFEIGSVTKTFTAGLVAGAVAAGLLDPDATLDRYLPLQRAPAGREPVRLRHLVTHSAGLDPAPLSFLLPWLRALVQDRGNPYGFVTLEHYLSYLDGAEAEGTPGERWAYDNAGYGLLGTILERTEGMPWAALVRARLLQPLGMDETFVDLAADDPRLVPGVNARGRRAARWRMPFMAPAGGLLSTLDDMERWVRAQLSPPAALSFLVDTHEVTALETAIPGHRMTRGWIAAPDGWLWHNGGTGGYHVFVGVDPERDRGVVVLTNLSQAHPSNATEDGGSRVNRLGFALMAPGEAGAED